MKEKAIGKGWLAAHAGDLLSYGGLVLCLIVFSVLSQGRLWSAYNIRILIQAVCVYAILSLGAVFIYSMGYMDISVGAQVGVYCILCILTTNATGSLLAGFLVILGLALVCGLINGYVSVMLGLPSIVTSIFLSSIFGGAQVLLMERVGINSVSIEADVSFFKDTKVMVAAIVIIALIALYLYNFTQLGKYIKGIGANETATKYSGVSTTKWKVFAYAFFGICVAIAAFFLTARTGAAGKGTGTGYAMDIMVALLLGGMPLSGGMRSRVSKAVVGAFTFSLLEVGLPLIGVPNEMTFFVKAIIFIIVVLITCRKHSGTLPR